jgi:precorrin-6A synthase
MRTLLIIGIGSGNPEHMTIQAINALNRADVVLIPRKGPAKDDLAQLRREICDRFLTNPATRLVEFDLPVRDAADPSYLAGVADWHAAIADSYRRMLQAETGDDGVVALLVWGDPSLYDSTLRIVDRLARSADFAYEHEVIPGITSIQALAAGHRIALNTVGNPFQVTTGRKLKDGFPDDVDTAVVMLDGGLSFDHLDAAAFDIYWGAYLGTGDEILIAGKLADIAGEIRHARAEARARHGWIMDTYLLRRR